MKIDQYRVATTKDISELVNLINSSYRPISSEAGWTHESELIDGERINSRQLTEVLERDNSVVLIGFIRDEIVACVNINEEAGSIYITMLTVKPSCQNLGLGKAMLQRAEEYACAQYGAVVFNLFVVLERVELFNFYLRRGYQSTGITSDYPAAAGVGIPKTTGLKLVLLTKQSPRPELNRPKMD